MDLKGHLDLSEYKDLEKLYCAGNELTSIDISKNTKLKILDCSNNKLRELNFENNVNLEKLTCSENSWLTKLSGIEKCAELSLLNGSSEKDELKELLQKFTDTKGKASELADKITNNKKIQEKREERKKRGGE